MAGLALKKLKDGMKGSKDASIKQAHDKRMAKLQSRQNKADTNV